MIWVVLAVQLVILIVVIYAARKAMWAARIASRVQGHVDAASVATTQQIEALDGLYRRLEMKRGDLPPTRGWAASPDVLTVLYDQARDARAKCIVECGSGASTIVLARYCQQMGDAQVLSVDHDEKYAGITRQRLADLGLDEYVRMIVAPLNRQPVGSGHWLWYDLSKIEFPETIDLAFVDGPPVVITGEDGRTPAGALLVPRLSVGGRILFDDAARPGERRLIADLVKAFPRLEKEDPNAEKGCTVLINRGKE
ncbi:O-methyltransferase [Salinisphaera sp. SWV1]|uniref:O-methyltransferase n=1 Tax=Salinisphaera sp. SWV1 TaxID=3454139 RepID=UPI003F8512AD